jgi:hypothetical protein
MQQCPWVGWLYLGTVIDIARAAWSGTRWPITCAPSWSPPRWPTRSRPAIRTLA